MATTVTFLYDPMISVISDFASKSPLFNVFMQDAMRTDRAVFIQTIGHAMVFHVTDFVLDEYYRHMGC